MNELIAFGGHRMWVDGDVARVTHEGLVSLRDAQTAYNQLVRWHNEGKIQYLLVDMRRMLPYEPAVRRWLAMEAPPLLLRGTAMVGMTTSVRVVLSLLERALALVGKSLPSNLHAANSIDEAKAWFEQDRKKHQAGGP